MKIKNTTLYHGSNLEILQKLINDNIKVDSIVTDPPYELDFMGKSWDSTGIAYNVELWKLCLQILKPGGYLLAFSGTRTYHRMVCAIQDAGFDIRDQLAWVYGSGFPKAQDTAKAIDIHLGVTPNVIGKEKLSNDIRAGGFLDIQHIEHEGKSREAYERDVTEPTSPEAKKWTGWKNALKPAWEPICLARKPMIGSTPENVLKYGTGAMNIDACRIPTTDLKQIIGNGMKSQTEMNKNQGFRPKNYYEDQEGHLYTPSEKGRFPANLIHDGSEEVEKEFAKCGNRKAGASVSGNESSNLTKDIYGKYETRDAFSSYNDDGSVSRFFYSAKANKNDRAGSSHPTVKPVALMEYLCKLVTQPNGLILDPFAGSGTTAEGAYRNRFETILIEKEDVYCKDIENRLNNMTLPTNKNNLKKLGDKVKNSSKIKNNDINKSNDVNKLFELK